MYLQLNTEKMFCLIIGTSGYKRMGIFFYIDVVFMYEMCKPFKKQSKKERIDGHRQ